MAMEVRPILRPAAPSAPMDKYGDSGSDIAQEGRPAAADFRVLRIVSNIRAIACAVGLAILLAGSLTILRHPGPELRGVVHKGVIGKAASLDAGAVPTLVFPMQSASPEGVSEASTLTDEEEFRKRFKEIAPDETICEEKIDQLHDGFREQTKFAPLIDVDQFILGFIKSGALVPCSTTTTTGTTTTGTTTVTISTSKTVTHTTVTHTITSTVTQTSTSILKIYFGLILDVKSNKTWRRPSVPTQRSTNTTTATSMLLTECESDISDEAAFVRCFSELARRVPTFTELTGIDEAIHAARPIHPGHPTIHKLHAWYHQQTELAIVQDVDAQIREVVAAMGALLEAELPSKALEAELPSHMKTGMQRAAAGRPMSTLKPNSEKPAVSEDEFINKLIKDRLEAGKHAQREAEENRIAEQIAGLIPDMSAAAPTATNSAPSAPA